MSDSQVTDLQSNSVLTKLLEADASLAVQETELTTQLEAIREKRQSLSTVINLFSPNSGEVPSKNNVAAKSAEVEQLVAQLAPVVAPVATNNTATNNEKPKSKAKAAAEPPPEPPAEAEVPAKGRGKGRGRRGPASQKQSAPTAKKGAKGPRGGRKSENWQNYVRDQFRQSSLTVAVSTVMQQQPNGIFEVPDIIDAIFTEDMPAAIRTKARDRILHVLSAGVRDEQWYRGKMGQYSLSRNAAVASRAAS